MVSISAGPAPLPAYYDEHLSVDFHKQSALLDNQPMSLTRKEYELLALMVEHAGEIVPRHELLMRIWGYGADIKTRTLDVHVRRLRKKLGAFADTYIETIFGIGYRFQPFHAPRFRDAVPLKPVAIPA